MTKESTTLVLTPAITFVAYGLLHMWKPITFGWTDVKWLPFYSGFSSGPVNWKAVAVISPLAYYAAMKLAENKYKRKNVQET